MKNVNDHQYVKQNSRPNGINANETDNTTNEQAGYVFAYHLSEISSDTSHLGWISTLSILPEIWRNTKQFVKYPTVDVDVAMATSNGLN